MTKRTAWNAFCVAALVAGFPVVPALAQQVGNTASNGSPEIETVIVSARRQLENEQKVPLAISTVSADRLKSATVESISDIQRLVPSLQIVQGLTGLQNFTIRGSFAGLFADPGVITYFDDVPVDPRALPYSLYDLSSVQELKGPQGTLFGKNSTGGAVLFFANRPDTTATGGYLTARYGNYNDVRFEGAANYPVSDTLAFRVAGEWEHRDGLYHSVTAPGLDFDNKNNYSVRVSALWQPTSNFEDYLQGTYSHVREHASPFINTSVAGPCTGPATPGADCLFQPPFTTILGTANIQAYSQQQQGLRSDQTVNNNPFKNFVDYDSVTNSLTASFGAVSIRNITSYSGTQLSFSEDYDGTPAPLFQTEEDSKFTVFSNETQIYGKLFRDRLDWRVGGVYNDQKGEDPIYAVEAQTPNSFISPVYTDSKYDYKSSALFGQATYDLSDWLRGVSLTAGYRYTWDNRSTVISRFEGQGYPGTLLCGLQFVSPLSGVSSPPVIIPGADLTTCTRPLKEKFSNDNYNLTADWQVTDKILLYAATRKGYKAGGFNQTAADPSETTYQPEVVKDEEIGVKADWNIGEMPIRTNAALFEARYDDFQSSVAINDPNVGLTQLVLNQDPATGAPNKALFKGGEVEATILPADWLEVSAFYSKVDATYSRFILPVSLATTVPIDLSGQNVDSVIPETWGVTTQVTVPITQLADQLVYTASYYASAAALTNVTSVNSPQSNASLDMRLEFRNVLHTDASLALYGKNILDKVVCTPFDLGLGAPVKTCTDPAFYGVEVTYRFGD